MLCGVIRSKHFATFCAQELVKSRMKGAWDDTPPFTNLKKFSLPSRPLVKRASSLPSDAKGLVPRPWDLPGGEMWPYRFSGIVPVSRYQRLSVDMEERNLRHDRIRLRTGDVVMDSAARLAYAAAGTPYGLSDRVR
ncbi:hypothetical protein E5D57_002097 [Metarhizium anisopliae]|nr:hypothetical protein E5D57_002097 [Metarhizium anisopliae]